MEGEGEIDQVAANKDNLRSAVLFEKFKPAAALTD